MPVACECGRHCLFIGRGYAGAWSSFLENNIIVAVWKSMSCVNPKRGIKRGDISTFICNFAPVFKIIINAKHQKHSDYCPR